MRKEMILIAAVFCSIMLISSASATLTVSIEQFGADSGSVMKSAPFTVTVSGLTGSGSVTLTTLQNSSIFSSSENSTKTYSDGTTSVSWTTVTANEKLSAQTISAVSAVPYSDSGTSSAFDIKLPPSIITSVTPSSFSNPSGSQTLQMSIQNWGETAAQSVGVELSLPSGATLSSGSSTQTISSIEGGEGGSGESVGLSWTLSFSGVSTSSIIIITTPSNADSKTDTIPIYTSGSVNPPAGDTGGTGGSGGTGGPSEKKESRKPALVPGVGLRSNLKLQAAIENVLAKGKMDQEAFQNLMRLSESITANTSLTRSIRAYNGTTTLTSSFRNSGKDKMKNFIIYEKVPKAFASNAANITVTAIGVSGYQTVETDPEYVFTYSGIFPGQEVNITYTIKREVNTSIIDQFQAEVYAEGLETAAAGEEEPSGPTGPGLVSICNPGERRCSGMDLQQCAVLGDNWVTLQTCQTSCQDNTCAGEAPSFGVIISDWGWLIIVAVSSTIAGVAVMLRKKHQKKKPFSMQSNGKQVAPSTTSHF